MSINRSSYIRSIAQSNELSSEAAEQLVNLSQAFKATGNDGMYLKLQSISASVCLARDIMNTAVESQIEDQIAFLKEAPLALPQDMGASNGDHS